MRTLLAMVVLCAAQSALAVEDDARAYFPLDAGNWWAYEELDEDGTALSRETWTLTADPGSARPGELVLRAATKRLDVLARVGGHRFEGREYLRGSAVGIYKRYPPGRDAETEVLLVKEPVASGTRWHDAQGDCEVTSQGPCAGPRGELPDCAIVVCRLGDPTVTVVRSTYARGVGMVRQEVEVLQIVPSFPGGSSVPLPSDGTQGGHSLLRLTAFHVAPR
jgi:hypothetical protein